MARGKKKKKIIIVIFYHQTHVLPLLVRAIVGGKILFHFLALPIAWQHTPKAPNLRGITPQRPLDN
jgi:hypothetical protein